MSLVWELRSFCRYVCPVAAFISPFSHSARLGVRSRRSEVCEKCGDKACLNGNSYGWACPYGICVDRMDSNADCGMCTECFKSCPYNNVALQWRKSRWEGQFTTSAEAVQAIALTVMAAIYSLTVHSPWPGLRDMVNVVDKADWAQFGLYASVLWLLALGAVPLLFWLFVSMGLKLTGVKDVTDRSAPVNTLQPFMRWTMLMCATRERPSSAKPTDVIRLQDPETRLQSRTCQSLREPRPSSADTVDRLNPVFGRH